MVLQEAFIPWTHVQARKVLDLLEHTRDKKFISIDLAKLTCTPNNYVQKNIELLTQRCPEHWRDVEVSFHKIKWTLSQEEELIKMLMLTGADFDVLQKSFPTFTKLQIHSKVTKMLMRKTDLLAIYLGEEVRTVTTIRDLDRLLKRREETEKGKTLIVATMDKKIEYMDSILVTKKCFADKEDEAPQKMSAVFDEKIELLRKLYSVDKVTTTQAIPSCASTSLVVSASQDVPAPAATPEASPIVPVTSAVVEIKYANPQAYIYVDGFDPNNVANQDLVLPRVLSYIAALGCWNIPQKNTDSLLPSHTAITLTGYSIAALL